MENLMKQLEADQTKIEAMQKEIDVLSKERDELKSFLEKIKVESDAKEKKYNADIDSLKTELDAEKKKNVEITEKLDQVEKKLANPAFADASIKGGEPLGDGSVVTEKAMTYDDAIAEYRKITDARKRAEFRAKYARELRLEK